MLWAALLFRLDPPIKNENISGNFMGSMTILDRDRVAFCGEDKDLFIGVQPHHIMGTLFSSVISTSGASDLVEHKPGDRFYVKNTNLLLNYTFRGGARIAVWQIPTGMCDDYNVFSTQQRSAVIEVNDNFEKDT